MKVQELVINSRWRQFYTHIGREIEGLPTSAKTLTLSTFHLLSSLISTLIQVLLLNVSHVDLRQRDSCIRILYKEWICRGRVGSETGHLHEGEIYSLEFGKIVFLMVPPPPPVRVLVSGRQSEVPNAVDCSDSSDEFVSLVGSN